MPPKQSATLIWDGFSRSMLPAPMKFRGMISSARGTAFGAARRSGCRPRIRRHAELRATAPFSVRSRRRSGAERAGLAVGDTDSGNQWPANRRQRRRGILPNCVRVIRFSCVSATQRASASCSGSWPARQEIEFRAERPGQITPEQKARRAAWLKGEDQAGATQP